MKKLLFPVHGLSKTFAGVVLIITGKTISLWLAESQITGSPKRNKAVTCFF
ncbi:MAG: hypothetical protein IKC94_01080 [Lentisphaeria bacterium]|nr:hypothetical protein [Lentisphaeria bacterium]